jgi:hypothetical protein
MNANVASNSVSVPHAILFVVDSQSSQFDVPAYDATSPTSSNGDCVSVSVRASVDGNVQVSIGCGSAFSKFGLLAFEGVLATPSGRVAVVTSGMEEVVSLLHASPTATLRIRLDAFDNAQSVWIEVE